MHAGQNFKRKLTVCPLAHCDDTDLNFIPVIRKIAWKSWAHAKSLKNWRKRMGVEPAFKRQTVDLTEHSQQS